MRLPPLIIMGSVLGLGAGATAGAQEIARRIQSGPDGWVALRYAARADVCGNARLLRIGLGDGWRGPPWIWTRSEGPNDGSCESGPVQVLVLRSSGAIVSVRAGVGGAVSSAATDLGEVSTREAVGFLLDLAFRSDGRLGRDALLAAALADSVNLAPRLLELAGSSQHSRSLRESATGWLGRELAADPSILSRVVALARDPAAPLSVRSRAAGVIVHAGTAATAALAELAASDHPAVAKAALTALGRSDDPEARVVLRRAVSSADLPDPARVQAIRSLGNRDASPADVEALLRVWPGLGTDQTRGAMLDVLGEMGGSRNTDWLLSVAAGQAGTSGVRARAVRAAERAGAHADVLADLYDRVSDRRVKDALLEALARIGDRLALAKIEAVAREDTDPALRRSALRRLAQVGSDEARAAIEAVVENP